MSVIFELISRRVEANGGAVSGRHTGYRLAGHWVGSRQARDPGPEGWVPTA
jgi:hypothetical protein